MKKLGFLGLLLAISTLYAAHKKPGIEAEKKFVSVGSTGSRAYSNHAALPASPSTFREGPEGRVVPAGTHGKALITALKNNILRQLVNKGSE